MRNRHRLLLVVLPLAVMFAALFAQPVAAVDDPVWELPATQVTSAGKSASVVSSADGLHLMAIWLHTSGGKRIVQVSRSDDGGANWGSISDLSALGQPARDADIAMSADGTRITAVWNRFDGSAFVAQARTSTDGGVTWGPVIDLATGAASTRLASSSDGARLAAVWSHWNGSEDVVQIRTSADGGTSWNPVVELGSGVAPQIAASGDGISLSVLWLHPTPSLRSYLQFSGSADAGVTWGAAIDLSVPGDDAGSARIATSADGSHLTVVWVFSTGAEWAVRVRSSQDTGATWTATQDLDTSPAGVDAPWIVSSQDGSRLTAIWTRSDGEHWVVQVRHSVDGGDSWSPATGLTAADRNALNARVAASADGQRLTAVWRRFNGTSYVAQARTSVDGGATWGQPTTLSTPGEDVAPQVTSSADGTTLAVLWGLTEDREGPVQSVHGLQQFAGFMAGSSGLDFGQAQVGDPTNRTVTVNSTGDGPLRISGLQIAGPEAADFAVDSQSCVGAPVLPSATCSVTVRFVATRTGMASATLVFADNTTAGTHTVALTGTGTAPGFSANPGLVGFGEQVVGSSSPVSMVTVTNTGTAPLVFGPGAVTLGGSGQFAVVQDTCSGVSVPASGTCVVGVRFVPTAAGPTSGLLRWVSNAPGSPHTVPLSGAGQAAPNPPPADQKVRVAVKSAAVASVAKLPKMTRQGASLRWKSATKRICTVRGSKVRMLRKGTCKLKGSAPAVPGYKAFASTVRIRVK